MVDAEHENAMFMLLSLNGIAPRVFASLDPASSSGRLEQVTRAPSPSLSVTAVFQSASSGDALPPSTLGESSKYGPVMVGGGGGG